MQAPADKSQLVLDRFSFYLRYAMKNNLIGIEDIKAAFLTISERGDRILKRAVTALQAGKKDPKILYDRIYELTKRRSSSVNK
jgi:hypothetical protein